MKRKQGKILSSLVVFMFLFTLFPAPADAQEGITVEKAIGIVKNVFDVPDTYSKFTSGISDEGGMKRLTLSWEEPGDLGGHFQAQVDAGSGDIVSMYRWDQDSPSSQLPTLTVDEAAATARELLQKVAPAKAGHFRFQADNQIVPLSGYGGSLYLRFLRFENNIPVENDIASVEINMADGQISSYNMSWSDYELPSPQGLITPEEAAEVFKSGKMLEQQYFLRQEQPRKIQPLLVYALKHPSGGVIDAVTGEPVVIQGGTWRGLNEVASKDMAVGGMGSSAPMALTPEEISEIEKLENLISREDADKTIRELTGIPAAAELNSASLNPDYMDPEVKIWRLSYQIKSETEPADFGASINAETEELLSYYAYDNYNQDQKPDMTREAGQKIVEAWLPEVSDKMSSVRLEPVEEEINPRYEPQEWSFRYQRVVKGVLCPGNGINISVNRVSGKISYYNLRWNNVSFPDVTGLGTAEAHAAYLQHMPMSLVYLTDHDKNGKAAFHLVYMPRPTPPAQSARMIDAVTGAKLDWEGQEMKDRTVTAYDDIEGHFAQEQIQLLAVSGIMTEYGSSFRPQEEVKLVTVLRAMILANDGFYNQNLSDEEIMQRALSRKWISKEEKAQDQVDRGRIARLMVSSLGLDFVAQKSEMFVIPYSDAEKIPAEVKGAAGLTHGLGIIQGEGTTFNTSHLITRGETAAILVRTLGVK